MSNVNWLDLLFLLPLLAGLTVGIIRGFISEIIAFVVVILGVIGSRFGAPPCANWMVKQFGWVQEICDVVAYLVIFLVIAIALSLLAKLLAKLIKKIHLGWANRLFGGLFGMCKYALFILIAVFAMNRIDQRYHCFSKSKVVKQSVVYPQAVKIANDLLSVARSKSR